MERKRVLPVRVLKRILMKVMTKIMGMIWFTPIRMIQLQPLRGQECPRHTRTITRTRMDAA